MPRSVVIAIALATMATIATALAPFDDFKERRCSGYQPPPVKATRQFVDSLHYIPAGSRYNMYKLASNLPNYPYMGVDELYYDACYSRNVSTSRDNILSTNFGFGRPLFSFLPVVRPGIYHEGTPRDASQAWNTARLTVTLTDNKSFAFLTSCWTGVDEFAWNVVSNTPNLTARTRKLIEDHAVSLGFKRDNFIFLRYDSCRKGLGNPELEDHRHGHHHHHNF